MHTLDTDDRGVSEVIGAILVFGILVTLLGIIQAQAVPNQNQEIEVQHTAEVESDLINLHQTISAVSANGNGQSSSISAGTDYPSRLLFFNPPPVQGKIETSDPQNITIENIEADNSEVQDYVSSGSPNSIVINSSRLRYRAEYNEIQNEPTVRYEYGVLYSRFDDGLTVKNEGAVIDGPRINLLGIEGNYSTASSRQQSLSVEPVSAPARSVSISGDGSGNNIEIELQSNLSASEWRELYDPSSSSRIVGISNSGSNRVLFELDPGFDYELRLSKVALEQGVSKTEPAYIVPVQPGVTNAGVGEPVIVEYEVRDRFNNPVSGVTVEVEDPAGRTVATKTTNSEGRVTAQVTPPATQDYTGTIDLSGTSSTSCGSGKCEADYRTQVPRISLNPFTGVIVEGSQTGDAIGNINTGLDDETVSILLNNTDQTDSAKIQSLRINHYSPDPNGHSPVEFRNSSGESVDNIVIGGGFKDSTNSNIDALAPIPAGGEEEFAFVFNGSVSQGHYFVVTVIYDNQRARYFISPQGTSPLL